jgi:hypothetical protein
VRSIDAVSAVRKASVLCKCWRRASNHSGKCQRRSDGLLFERLHNASPFFDWGLKKVRANSVPEPPGPYSTRLQIDGWVKVLPNPEKTQSSLDLALDRRNKSMTGGLQRAIGPAQSLVKNCWNFLIIV